MEELTELEQRCLELGMTREEIAAVRATGEELVDHAIRRVVPGGHELTLAEVATRAGIDTTSAELIARASGVRPEEMDEPLFGEADVSAMSLLAAAEALLGIDAVVQLVRVASASVARIGDAAISTFFTGAGAKAVQDDETGVALLDANLAAAALLPAFGDLMNGMLVRHLARSFRPLSDEHLDAALAGIDTWRLAIGFADLVDSTVLADRASLPELNEALDAFERAATDTVQDRGGRVVKFIGDEVMFRADTADAALAIATDLVDLVRRDPRLPALRVGVAHGDVLTRDGDFHGPVVNTAARATKLAAPDTVVATAAAVATLDSDAGFTLAPLGSVEMRGVSEPVELVAVGR